MFPNIDPEHPAIKPCAAIDDPDTADLAWLMHRAAQSLAEVFDAVCREAGLADLRDWLVLTTTGDGHRRTQLEISRALGIDKSTLMAILDRLEDKGFVVRELSPTDRRVRIPVATEEGRAIAERVSAERDEAVSGRLASMPAEEQSALRHSLWRVVTSAPVPVG